MKYTFSLFLIGLTLLAAPAFSQLQLINTIGGNGMEGYSGDGSDATSAELFDPQNVVLDSTGNIYIEDHLNNRIRKINTNGKIYTYAGTGVAGYTGDGSLATSADIVPDGLAIDHHGNLYVSDASYNVVRKISASGIITTVAGSGVLGYAGDGAAATSATLDEPRGIAVDTSGNIYIADAGNNAIRMVNSAGIIKTIAGTGTAGYFGDGGLAVYAQLDTPSAIAIDHYGNIYISDTKNSVIRKIDTSTTITTYAGVYNSFGYNGDGGVATAAYLNRPQGLAIDSNRTLYIADATNNRIRAVDTSGTITTAAGNGYAGFGGDLGTVNGANLFNPYGVAVDNYGSLYIADANNERIRKTYNPSLTVPAITGQNHITAYPDPFTDQVTITGLAATDQIAVLDMAGKQITDYVTAGGSEAALSLHNMAKGIYLLQVYTGAGSRKAVIKLVKK